MRKILFIKGMGHEWKFEVKGSAGIYTVRPLAYPKSEKVDAMTCDDFHENSCTRTFGVRTLVKDHCLRWRANGNLKTWVTRPDEFRLPIKHGMRTFGELTHNHNNGVLHPADKCPMNLIPETRKKLEALLEGLPDLDSSQCMPDGYVSKVYPAGVPREGEWVHAWSTPTMSGLSFEYYPYETLAREASDEFMTHHARKLPKSGENTDRVLLGDGYADGGAPYTDEEMALFDFGEGQQVPGTSREDMHQ